MAKYSDAPFQGITLRRWYGQTIKHGGSGAIITFNETQATKVTRVYLRGPVKIKKFGCYVAATLGKGEQLFSLSVNGTGTAPFSGGTVVASSAAAPFTISSVTAAKVVNAGSYLSILASTNVCSTGSVALFIDYIPQYQVGNSKWDP